ncbi:hypothetical protein [Micromonospora auratinigra]|uniref:Uncharacterized protein n=1 Tax=Micromonospora auratinigra TaxID=261654 RepID=A0A1A8ZB87_9ACTN|nr:hypothetical protein [Micromonospora auratinigra]SBT41125.1 hypothetical protein GA0070611_1509 [Micromonospora auratinigra]
MDEEAREQALLTALTTEHVVLQTSRSTIIAELLLGLGVTLLTGLWGPAPGPATAIGPVVAFATQIDYLNRISVTLNR